MLNYKSNEEKITYKSFYSKLNRIIDMSKKIVSSLDVEDIVEVLGEEIIKLNNSDVIGIGLFNKKETNIEYRFYLKGKIEEHTSIYLNNNKERNFLIDCFNEKTEIFINNIEDSKYSGSKILKTLDYRIESLICIPLLIKNNAIGLISIQSYEKNMYTMEDLNELRVIAGYTSIALENGSIFSKVKYCAEHDDLTGLLKRNKILDEGKKFNEFSVDNKNVYSLIMIDIDYFKRINDEYGHDVGDAVLKDISRIIKSTIRKGDFIGRYGGEEFLIILPYADAECAEKIAERIRRAVELYNYKAYKNEYKNVTISLGIYQMNFNNNDFMGGLKKADKALYQAKKSGRNRSVIYKNNLK